VSEVNGLSGGFEAVSIGGGEKEKDRGGNGEHEYQELIRKRKRKGDKIWVSQDGSDSHNSEG